MVEPAAIWPLGDLVGDHLRGRGQHRADEEEVFAHAGGLGDGVAAVEAHDGRGQRGRDARGRGDGPEVHARRLPDILPERTIGWTTMM